MNTPNQYNLIDYNVQIKGHVNLDTLQIDWISEKYSRFYQCVLIQPNDEIRQLKSHMRLIFEDKEKELFDSITEELSKNRHIRFKDIAILDTSFTIKACHIRVETAFKFKVMTRDNITKKKIPLICTTYDENGKPVRRKVTKSSIEIIVLEKELSYVDKIINNLIESVKKWRTK